MRNYRAFRVRHEMTQETFAELLGISQSYLALLESGRREASHKLNKRYDALAGKSKESNLIPDTPTKKILTDSNEKHLKDSILYLESYRKDCESQLHRFEKQLNEYKSRSLTAKIDILVAGLYTNAVGASKDKDLMEREVEERKNKLAVSNSALDYVLNQKPEIKLIKIKGLQEEIRKLKPIIARKKKMLKVKQFNSMDIPGMETHESPLQEPIKIMESVDRTGSKDVTSPPAPSAENGDSQSNENDNFNTTDSEKLTDNETDQEQETA